MLLDADAVVVAATTAICAVRGHARATALLGSLIHARNRSIVAGLHERAIIAACAAADKASSVVDIDHEDRPECLRLTMRIERVTNSDHTGLSR